ncbi:MAG TPA: histone deacetylase [Candidatus Limnocylindria bacterium]|nr:histone deacetylase [Candidatus Limnocylindria bacterium]
MSPRVLLLTDPAMLRHAAPGHPERPERMAAVEAGLVAGAARAGAELDRRRPEPASAEAVARVHDPAFVAELDRLAGGGGGWLDPDTYLTSSSMPAARLAAGATLEAGRAAASGEASVAFAVVRPPGHHASAARACGFCLLNNVAVAVEELRAALGLSRIAIVDWDVHHGDGTQEIYDPDPDVCYTSTHGWPLYPGTGARDETGTGPAAGTKHNRPLPPGSGDEQFVAAWRDDLLPAVEAFGAEAILVSAGYDAHRDDPLAHLAVTERGYRSVAVLLGELAARLRLPGVALTLEGGYDLGALEGSAAATVEGLLTGLAARAGGS